MSLESWDDGGASDWSGATSPNRAEFLRDLVDAARANPIPAALIGIGAVWLFARGSGEIAARVALPAGDAVKATIKAATSQISAAMPASDAGEMAREKLSDAGHWMQQGLVSVWEEQPLAAGVAGLALGAGLAALLPMTSAEADIFGPEVERLASATKIRSAPAISPNR